MPSDDNTPRPPLSIRVVTPWFNQCSYLQATLDSVLDQGCSTDGSVELIREYEPRLTSWVSEPDRGHANALDKGFAGSSAGGALDESLACAADCELWLRFLRLAPLHHVRTVLGGRRMHDAPLGEQGGGRYEQEAAALVIRFAAESSPSARRRGRLVRRFSTGRRRVVGHALHRFGAWPWYRRPKIGWDFSAQRWTHF